MPSVYAIDIKGSAGTVIISLMHQTFIYAPCIDILYIYEQFLYTDNRSPFWQQNTPSIS